MSPSKQSCLILVCSAFAMLGSAAHNDVVAQDTSAEDTSAAHDSFNKGRSNWMVAFSAGLPGYRTETFPEAFTVGLNFTQLRRNGLGGDFAVGVVPRAMFEGAMALGTRAGFVVPLEVAQGFYFLPSAGASVAIVAVGDGGGGGVFGANAGAATLISSPQSKSGLRIGVTWHQFAGFDEPFWLLEVGIAGMPGLRR